MPRVKKFPIIGGPLDGQFANLKDWYAAASYTQPSMQRYNHPGGQFEQWKDEYLRFNSGDGLGDSSMVFLHHSLVTAPIRVEQSPSELSCSL